MPVYDGRNILHIGPPQREGDPEITPAMAESVRVRIPPAYVKCFDRNPIVLANSSCGILVAGLR
jgi:hypothetical protein